MADFIYLLQNRLTPAQWRAVEAVREAARTHGMPVFLVGGAVRDLASGSPVRDLDFAVQGDVGPVVGDLEAAGATVTGRNAVLSSAYVTFRGGVRAEVSPSLSVSYPKPGEAVAQPAPILDDLRRRDFTANAMAVSLNEGSYGLLLDPLNGTADLENRELRLVSPYGFIEQPALLLRAARLSERLGWTLEERTATRYQTSKEEGHIQAMPAFDRGYELEEIFHEEDPVAILQHMQAEGWAEALFPALQPGDADRTGMEAVRDLIGQMESQGIHPDPSAVYFPLVTARLAEKDRAALKQLFARPGFVAQIESIEARAKELSTQLTSKASASASETWKLLKRSDPEVVLWLAFHARAGAVQTKIKSFLKDWPQMRQKIPYALMQEMRITPDLPDYDKLLDDLFFALIDGKLDTPEATRAFLEPFSPPAPPQVAVRRRPAKATRGRAKRAAAAEELVADAPDEAPEADDDESFLDKTEEPDARDEDESDDEDAPEPEERTPEPARTEVPLAQAAPMPASPLAPSPKQTSVKSPAKSVGSAPDPVVIAAKKTAPAKSEAPHKSVTAPVKPVVKAAAKKTAPVKKLPAKKSAPLKLAAKAVPAKKAQTTKTPAKAAEKTATKKAVATKTPAKSNASKAAVKKQPAKVSAPVAAKRAVPAKATKKVAAKKRAR